MSRRPPLLRATAGIVVAVLLIALAMVGLRGIHPGRALAVASIGFAALAVLLVPLVVLETRAVRRFESLEQRLRQAWPDADVRAVERPDGRGYAFMRGSSDGSAGPAAREVLLLRPAGGVGPALVVLDDGRSFEASTPEDLDPLLQVEPPTTS